ncbi:POK10 protein, partial [Pelecanoides urinatrix]|nr:POK10 protein [Pelecanoides urinatrix]
LGEGNARADSLVLFQTNVDSLQAARASHHMFHQNAKTLRRQFHLSWSDAQGIVKSCDQCSNHSGPVSLGVNPRGLAATELWQMDVTHIAEFGRHKYVHVTIDTFSHMIWATAQ